MSDESALYQILDYILNRATPAELEVIAEAIKRRTTDQYPADKSEDSGKMSPRSMAQGMAKRVKEQLSALNIGEVSRKIVTDLIRQKEPEISEEDLQVLLDRWLPSSAPKQRPPSREALVAMIVQYVAYRRGKLSPEEQQGLPEHWPELYWRALPEMIRKLIEDLLNGALPEHLFWERVVELLGR